jgi:hypothetical protein
MYIYIDIYIHIHTCPYLCIKISVDGDTTVSHGSFAAAMYAAGSVIQGVDMIMKGEIKNAFCAVRPPGHHAGFSIILFLTSFFGHIFIYFLTSFCTDVFDWSV